MAKIVSCFCLILFCSLNLFPQSNGEVEWLKFEQLEDSLKSNPKKVFVDFYADWCGPCLKMQRTTFKDKEVIKTLNSDYYSVRMNVESADTIRFGGQSFVNERQNRRNPVHQIPLLMGRRKNKAFNLPVLVFLDQNFTAKARYFQYLDAEQFLEILDKN